MLRRVLGCGVAAALGALGGCDVVDRDIFMPGDADRKLEAALQARASEANRAVAIPFDPARDALVFDTALEWIAVRRDLVAGHALPAAWQLSSDREVGAEAMRAVTPAACDAAERDPAFRAGGGRAERLPPPQGERLCLLVTLEAPPARVFRVTMGYEPLVTRKARIDRLRTFVEAPDGKRYMLEHYRLRGLPGPDLRAAELAGALGLRRRGAETQ